MASVFYIQLFNTFEIYLSIWFEMRIYLRDFQIVIFFAWHHLRNILFQLFCGDSLLICWFCFYNIVHAICLSIDSCISTKFLMPVTDSHFNIWLSKSPCNVLFSLLQHVPSYYKYQKFIFTEECWNTILIQFFLWYFYLNLEGSEEDRKVRESLELHRYLFKTIN